MGKFPASLIYYLGLLVTIFIQGTQGLKCYQCIYLNHDGQNIAGSVANCISGGTPNASSVSTCSWDSPEVKILIQNDDGSVGLRDAELPEYEQDLDFGCYKIHAEGTYQGKKRIWTQRGCAGFYKELKTQCRRKTVKKWLEDDDIWADITYWITSRFAEDDKVSSCYCSEDSCNAAPSTTLSFAVLMATTAFALSMQRYLQ